MGEGGRADTAVQIASRWEKGVWLTKLCNKREKGV